MGIESLKYLDYGASCTYLPTDLLTYSLTHDAESFLRS